MCFNVVSWSGATHERWRCVHETALVVDAVNRVPPVFTFKDKYQTFPKIFSKLVQQFIVLYYIHVNVTDIKIPVSTKCYSKKLYIFCPLSNSCLCSKQGLVCQLLLMLHMQHETDSQVSDSLC